MPQNTNQNRVTFAQDAENRNLENLFYDAYQLRARIEKVSINDQNWDWVQAILKFKDSLGKTYGLVEYFKQGMDNSTDYVVLEYETEDGLVKETFPTFIQAELAMVDLMRNRLGGKDGNS